MDMLLPSGCPGQRTLPGRGAGHPIKLCRSGRRCDPGARARQADRALVAGWCVSAWN